MQIDKQITDYVYTSLAHMQQGIINSTPALVLSMCYKLQDQLYFFVVVHHKFSHGPHVLHTAHMLIFQEYFL